MNLKPMGKFGKILLNLAKITWNYLNYVIFVKLSFFVIKIGYLE
jgi:hypothetical protein